MCLISLLWVSWWVSGGEGDDSVHVCVTFFVRGNNNMSLFFWVHVLLGEVCAVSWGRAYVLR